MWVRPMVSAVLALGVLLLATACGSGGGGSKDAVSVTVRSTPVIKPIRSKAQCLKLAQALGSASGEVNQAMAGTIFAWDPLSDSSGFHGRDIVRDSRTFTRVVAGAPDEVKAAFGTFSNALARLAVAVRGVSLDGTTKPSAEQLARLGGFQSSTDSRKLARAQGQLTTWFSTRCRYY